MPDAREFQGRMEQLDEFLREAENADPAMRGRLQELASALLEVHGMAIQRILEHVSAAGEAGAAILDACGRDETVSAMLALHGLHPLDVETRVRCALEKVGPYLASHGGHVELISVSPDGAVNLRLEGSCHGCPSSRVTLQTSIEQEIYAAAPEVISISVEGLAEPPPPQPGGFIPIDRVAVNGSAIHAAASSLT